MTAPRKDLVVLTADKSIERVISCLLTRRQALGIRRVEFDVFVHPGRDPGCLNKSHDFLRPFQSQYAHALVVFDKAGSGAETRARTDIEEKLTQRLAANGWRGRAGVVVIDPELEVWVWSDSPEVDACLGWSDRSPALRQWLRTRGLWEEDDTKPQMPKEAFEAALQCVRIPLSSAIFAELAQSVSVNRCRDSSFQALRDLLTDWFQAPGTPDPPRNGREKA
jgi:hypothetical protein